VAVLVCDEKADAGPRVLPSFFFMSVPAFEERGDQHNLMRQTRNCRRAAHAVVLIDTGARAS
jgi:hypothetical protein